MGCFLTLTERDFERLSSGLKAGINVVDNRPGEVKIEVKSTAYQSAREMAKQIRSQARSAQVTDGSVKESRYAVATTERFQHMVSTLSEISPSLLPMFFNDTQRQFNTAMVRAGKLEAEPIAAKILVQSGYLDGGQKYSVTRSTGIDVQGRNVANTQVVVEVKLSIQDKDFGARMSTGAYKDESHPEGYREMSNGWFSKVSKDFDPANAHILGVHIDPVKETVTIYRRTDPEARSWQPLLTKSLSDFKF